MHLNPEGDAASPLVGIWSPSGSFANTPEKTALFERGVARLKHHGFSVRESSNCRGSWHHASASPSERVSDLWELLDDPEVAVVLPSIGGHVAAQLLPDLDFKRIATSRKRIFGFSDNSIIPLVTSSQTGARTYHSLCDVTFGLGRYSDSNYRFTEEHFLAAILRNQFDIPGPTARIVQRGRARGVLLGGNLTGIVSLLGTPWSPDWRGKIMFWESIDPMRTVVHQLVQLSNAGAFDGLAGMIVGRVSTLREDFYGEGQVTPIPYLLQDVLGLRDRFPIVIEADVGHDVENVTMPLGATIDLRAEDVVSGKVV